jgi:hypothetical protein
MAELTPEQENECRDVIDEVLKEGSSWFVVYGKDHSAIAGSMMWRLTADGRFDAKIEDSNERGVRINVWKRPDRERVRGGAADIQILEEAGDTSDIFRNLRLHYHVTKK